MRYEDIAQITFQTRLPKWFNKRPSRFQNHSAGGMTKIWVLSDLCQKIVIKVKIFFPPEPTIWKCFLFISSSKQELKSQL